MPNRNYDAGVRFERERLHDYESRGFVVSRSAGSHGAFDLWAIQPHGDTLYVIQCKVVKTRGEAEALAKKWKATPPMPPTLTGCYTQVLEVKIKGQGEVLRWVV
jgi:hypothetical protein